MTNGKQLLVLSSFVIIICAAATSGCSKDFCDDAQFAAENRDICLPMGGDGGVNPDSGHTPDSGVNPDSGTPAGTFTVPGTIDDSWGAITKVEMTSVSLEVITPTCTITPIENGHIRFSCTGPVQPENKFLVRFWVGSTVRATVTNWPGSTATATCALAHGVYIGDITEGSDKFGYEIFSTNPGVADPSNPCRQSY